MPPSAHGRKQSVEQKIDALITFLRDGHLALARHHSAVETTFQAMVADVQTFDKNLHTFYENTGMTAQQVKTWFSLPAGSR